MLCKMLVLTSSPSPPPSLCMLHRYKREDGLDLTATLYLPPGYDKERDGRLPCILWAYPREFKTKVRLSNATHVSAPAGYRSSCLY